jgi:hypothetical protein
MDRSLCPSDLTIEKTLAYYEICPFFVNYESVMFYRASHHCPPSTILPGRRRRRKIKVFMTAATDHQRPPFDCKRTRRRDGPGSQGVLPGRRRVPPSYPDESSAVQR